MQEFSPGSSGRMTTMGVYVRDLILGQVCFLTSFCTVSLTNCCVNVSSKWINICHDNSVLITEESSCLSLWLDLSTEASAPCFSYKLDFYTIYEDLAHVMVTSDEFFFCCNASERFLILLLFHVCSETMPTNWTIFLVRQVMVPQYSLFIVYTLLSSFFFSD